MKCIILAGGFGERLWPVSRELYPKSLLDFNGKNTLVQNVYNLAKTITTDKNIITVTNIRQVSDTILQLKKYSDSPIVISEPMSKNTAPAIASALEFIQSDKDETVIILPVDFTVDDEASFKASIEKAKNSAKSCNIVTLGIRTKHYEPGFGYIETKEIKNTIKKVSKFIEKPSKNTISEETFSEGCYLNSGIYIGKISVFMDAFKKYAPEINENFSKDMFDENNKIKYEFYENIPEISIDYAIIEKYNKLTCVELDCGWKDFGSWHAVYVNGKKDKHNNVISGNVIAENTKDSFIFSSKELVATAGLKNTIVIETEDAVLVCDDSRASDIGKIVKQLKQKSDSSAIERKTVFRPWGYYTCLNSGDGWLTKVITVSPGHKLSLQSHNYRSEHWVVLEGVATVILDEQTHVLNKRQSIDISVNSKHSLQNLSDKILKILEVQKGSYIGEDDIIRYEDMYGRIN